MIVNAVAVQLEKIFLGVYDRISCRQFFGYFRRKDFTEVPKLNDAIASLPAVLESFPFSGITKRAPVPDSFFSTTRPLGRWKPRQITTLTWNILAPNYTVLGIVKNDRYNTMFCGRQVDLEYAAPLSLNCFFVTPFLFQGVGVGSFSVKMQQVEDTIAAFGSISSHDGYLVSDEQLAPTFSYWGAVVARIRSLDPTRLSYLNLLSYFDKDASFYGIDASTINVGLLNYPTGLTGVPAGVPSVIAYLEYLRLFIRDVDPDLLSYDNYQTPPNWWLNLSLCSDVAKANNLPLFVIYQANDFLPSNLDYSRVVHDGMLRRSIFSAIAYGALGLVGFVGWGDSQVGDGYRTLYDRNKPSDSSEAVATINQEIALVSQWRMNRDWMGAFHTTSFFGTRNYNPATLPIQFSAGKFAVGIFGNVGVANGCLIMNQDDNLPQSLMITASRSVKVMNKVTGVFEIKISGSGSYQLFLFPGDGFFLEF